MNDNPRKAKAPSSSVADQPGEIDSSDSVQDPEERLVETGLKYLERGMLFLVVVLTLFAAYEEIRTVIAAGSVQLGDVLLMFLYTEVIAMVAVFYTGRGQPFVFPIFIAITALARLIVLQSKDMDPYSIAIEAGAILLLSFAAVVLLRFLRK
ncbi:phosphate-starvation-inducible protein PsiE [Roseovarius sp. D22-M7]|uniref:phosphate-starvation-inducible protein PsiE n=1 Tax=Roseovarius sp. D22-M7 TaxID=3127116 RepID=UPI0030104234